MARTTFFNHTAPGWTSSGAPTLSDDQHNPDSCYEYDDVDDRIHNTAIPIGNGLSGYSFLLWHQATLGSGFIANQRPISGYPGTNTAYDLSVADNGSISFSHREGDNAKHLSSIASASSFTHGTYHLFGVTVDLVTRDVNIFVDGVETTYSTQDAQVGGPSAATANMTRLGLGSVYNDSYLAGAKGIISRGIFEEQVLTPAQMLTEYNNEVAAIGQGFSTGSREGIFREFSRKLARFVPRGLIR